MPTEQQTETRRQIAERVVRETILVVPGKIADRYIAAIEAALKDRDERAARIAETHCAADCDGFDCGAVIARDIRNEDHK